MQIIDAQVHCYERDHPGRPWIGVLPGPAEVTGDDMVRAMDAVQVDGAILVSVFAMYGFDPGYALEVGAAHPTRFGVVRPVDTSDPAIADVIAHWSAQPGAVGIRLLLKDDVSPDPADPGLNLAVREAGRRGIAVNVAAWKRLDQVKELAKRHPGTRIVIDHLGIHPPFSPPPSPEPFEDLPKLLALAEHSNVAVKVTGVPVLSHQPYPYPDIWDPLRRVFDAFGFDRCMWGTDWTRAVAFLTYRQGVEAFRLSDHLSDDERVRLMGETAASIYDWRPGVDRAWLGKR